MQQGIRRQVKSAGAHSDALHDEAARLRPLWESLRSQVIPVQARGVLLHEGTLRGNQRKTRPT